MRAGQGGGGQLHRGFARAPREAGLTAETLLSTLLKRLESRGSHPDLVEYVGLRCLAEYAPERLNGLSVRVEKSGNRFSALLFQGDDLIITPEPTTTDGTA